MAPETTTQTEVRSPLAVEFLRKNPTCSVTEAAGILGISRAYAYALVRSGELASIKLGQKRFRVKSKSLLKMLGED
jgi:excisionase family DNA binding protein